MRALPILMAIALLAGCGGHDDTIEGAPDEGAPARRAGPDLSSPMSAVKAFWAAYLARDAGIAAACVAETTRSEQLRLVLAGDACALAHETDDGTDWSIDHTSKIDPFDGDTRAEVKTVTRNGHHVDFVVVQTASGWKVEKFDI